MELTVLGAHQLESATTRCTTLLVDGVLALDASALTSSLSLAEQARLRAILITHYHYDHIKDLALLGFNTAFADTTLVGCAPVVQEMLLSHILNGQIWLNLTEFPSTEKPSLRFLSIEPGQGLTVEGYRVLGIPTFHAVPVTGYQLVGPDGRSLFYTSDTGPGWVEAALPHLLPDLGLIITEVTYANELRDISIKAGHLTPELLAAELRIYGERRGSVPPVLVVHINPHFEEPIRRELAAVSAELGAAITVGAEGMQIAV